ncbi:MAG TPA: hypothetical protein DDW23_02610 [Planctomycetes bacterium]|nr:hypothetical protein [Planctomycetota bacterium]|tara:strand:+ start:567 stop:827 length:261 start_codon:yes stop_codon:yes gene_type:complete
MDGVTLLIVILVFVGLAKSQKKSPLKGKRYFFAAAIVTALAEAWSAAGEMPMSEADEAGFWAMIHLLSTAGVLLAWFGAWKVLAED